MAWGFVQAAKEAWQWVKSGISSALGRQETLEQYTAGGGEIEAGDWDDAWALGERLYAEGRAIQDLPGEAIVSGFYFTRAPADYAAKYHMAAEVEFFNKSTEEWDTKFVSVNADELLTREDWELEMLRVIRDTETSAMVDLEQDISFYNFQAELAAWA